MVMTMVMISPSRRDVSPTEQLRRSPRLVSLRFRLVAVAFCPVSLLMIFFLTKDSIAKDGHRRATRGPRGRGRAQGVGRAPTLMAGGWPPLVLSSLSVFIYFENNFCEVSGLLELCRIGL